MKQFLLTAILFLCFYPVLSQQKSSRPLFDLGAGLGIDYGGIGARLSVLPIKQVKVFGALGYNIAGLGYNIGAGFRILPEKRTCPYVVGMYGYNAVMLVFVNGEYRSEYTKAFTGPSFGLGIEQRGSQEGKSYFNFELLVPLRSNEFTRYKERMEKQFSASFISIPIALSLGYHFTL